jgi:3-oxoacyl-[acyl-carrier-protein] synthase III
MNKFNDVYIAALSHYLPERSVTNDEIINLNNLKIKSSWIETRLGITRRRWAAESETTSDLVVHVLKQLKAQEAPLFLSTISPDYLTPSTASEVKRKMNWKGQSPAIDMSAACAGFIFSLEMGAVYLSATESKQVCCIGAETRSRFLNLNDRRTVFLFADASAGCVLQKNKENAVAKVLWTHLITESTVEPEILVPAGGAKTPLTAELFNDNQHKIRMVDGGQISHTIETKLVDEIKGALKNLNEEVSDYSFFVFHQGNAQLIKEVLSQLNLSEDQTHINFTNYGNSSSASVAVALSEASELKKIKKGQKVLMVAMGAGYHVGLAGLEWH